VDQRSGVSARFSIAGAETTAASALRRAAIHGEEHAVARLVDVEAAVEVLAGKIEFESGEEGREIAVLEHLLRRATMETVQSRLRGIDLGPLIQALDGTVTVSTGGDVPARDLLAELPTLEEDGAAPAGDDAEGTEGTGDTGASGDGPPGAGLYDRIAQRLGASTPGQRANAIELALEALFLSQKISKDADAEGTVYG
jgi:magnesium chelatase subunit I